MVQLGASVIHDSAHLEARVEQRAERFVDERGAEGPGQCDHRAPADHERALRERSFLDVIRNTIASPPF
jgi:hypothetical protein